ncbi:MAG: hypothetical protein K0R55_3960 [Sporomusa sp.]|nr:hypothetical protein [Sporomusa sp.]
MNKLGTQISFVTILLLVFLLAGCSQPQKKPEQSPTAPPPQSNMMGQADPSLMMHSNPEAMKTAMSAPENRQAMVTMMNSPQMRPVMIDMMKDPTMRQTMIDIMADPAMKNTFMLMVKDPRLAPIAKEALNQ